MCTLDIILKELKKQHKTQKELAEYLGMSKNAVSEWKSGRNTAYMKYLPQIAIFLNVPIDTLIGMDDIRVEAHNEPIYLDDETREIIDSLRTRPEMKILFSVSKNVSKEDIEAAVEMIKRFKKESD
jgi:transcriptional regulator with XRE-family HTH domain